MLTTTTPLRASFAPSWRGSDAEPRLEPAAVDPHHHRQLARRASPASRRSGRDSLRSRWSRKTMSPKIGPCMQRAPTSPPVPRRSTAPPAAAPASAARRPAAPRKGRQETRARRPRSSVPSTPPASVLTCANAGDCHDCAACNDHCESPPQRKHGVPSPVVLKPPAYLPAGLHLHPALCTCSMPVSPASAARA